MSYSQIDFLKRALWTVGSYGGSLAIRLASNVVLSRLLTPEIVGVMVIVHSIRYGIELLTDVGIEQNIVHNARGSQSDFINTAWTMQMLRGVLLSLAFLALSEPLSGFFAVDRGVFMAMSLAPLLTSLCSTSVFLLVRGMEVRQRNLFELGAEAVGLCVAVTLAVLTPTVWALVLGSLASIAIRAALSYRLPHPPYRLHLERRSAIDILQFGKWIALSSILIYASTNVDKLILGRSIALDLLGVYGLARTIADMPAALAGRLSYQVVFPALASAKERRPTEVIAALSSARWKFVLLGALVFGSGLAWSDVAVRILYDWRYHEAGWILFALLLGAWPAVLSNLNEATLLGFGKPALSSLANCSRLIVLATGIPIGLAHEGLPGAIAVMVISEIVRFALVLFGQIRVGLTFLRQDVLSTVVMLAIAVSWSYLRHVFDLPVAWAGLF